MFRLSRRTVAAAAAVAALGAGSATWATTSAAAATGHPAARAAQRVIPRCTAGDLAVWVNANSADGAAGTLYYHLEYTNISNIECHLDSWPGVAAVSSAGQLLGPSATRTGPAQGSYVNIPAGGTAHSVLGYVHAAVTKSCKPALATHLRVFAPGDASARDAFFPVSVCTTYTPDLVVWRVQPGH